MTRIQGNGAAGAPGDAQSPSPTAGASSPATASSSGNGTNHATSALQAKLQALETLPGAPAAPVAAALAVTPSVRAGELLGMPPLPPSHLGLQYAPPPPPVFSTSFKGVLPPLTDYRRITLKDLHIYTFYTLMPLASFSVRALLHPFTVVKTRMMAGGMPSPPVGAPAAALAAHEAAVRAAAMAEASGATATAAAAARPPSVPVPPQGGQLRATIAHILRTEGFKGLYAGFGVSVVSLAVGPVYMGTLLTTKEALEGMYKEQRPAPAAGVGVPALATPSLLSRASSASVSSSIPFVSGAFASCVAQCVGVPLDVIANKQMRGRDWHALPPDARRSAKPALQIAREVWQRQGVRGFYKGYFLTLMHNAPMSAMVWGTFEHLHPQTRRMFKMLGRALWPAAPATPDQPAKLHPSLIKWDVKELMMVGLSAGTAGGIASTCTLPLDVVKTRLQASRDPSATVRSTWRALLAERGWRGLHAGLSARLASAVPTSALLMMCFEALKRATIREDAEPDVQKLAQQRQQLKQQRMQGH